MKKYDYFKLEDEKQTQGEAMVSIVIIVLMVLLIICCYYLMTTKNKKYTNNTHTTNKEVSFNIFDSSDQIVNFVYHSDWIVENNTKSENYFPQTIIDKYNLEILISLNYNYNENYAQIILSKLQTPIDTDINELLLEIIRENNTNGIFTEIKNKDQINKNLLELTVNYIDNQANEIISREQIFQYQEQNHKNIYIFQVKSNNKITPELENILTTIYNSISFKNN